MIAGTLARLADVCSDPLESCFRDGSMLPGLDVEETQTSFDERPIQSGRAATRVTRKPRVPSVETTSSGASATLAVEKGVREESLLTDWVADVTGTGLIVAESVDGDSDLAFPFDLFWDVTGSRAIRLNVDIEALHGAWSDEDVLGDVWMSGADVGDGTSIDYHSRADPADRPTIGLGFERPWKGTVMRGVVYESGYLAVYNTGRSTDFIRFVEEELLSVVFEPGDDDVEQTTLGDQSSTTCERCGRDADHVVDGLCAVCRDWQHEEGSDKNVR